MTLDRELKRGSAEMMILSLVEDRGRHGYEILKRLEERSDGVLTVTAKDKPPSRPTSWIARMFGCESAAIALVSRSKRVSARGSADTLSGRALTATSRSRRVSTAQGASLLEDCASGHHNETVIPVHQDWSLTFLADIFNATNRVNWANAGSTLVTTSAFLIPTQDFQPREYQLGVRFELQRE